MRGEKSNVAWIVIELRLELRDAQVANVGVLDRRRRESVERGRRASVYLPVIVCYRISIGFGVEHASDFLVSDPRIEYESIVVRTGVFRLARS